jgi:FkbH-like protein
MPYPINTVARLESQLEVAGVRGAEDGAASTAAPFTAPVKLVIWDLDETLWSGTLSEGPVALDPEHAEIVRELNRRGIMSSICSKNDRSVAEQRLAQENLWQEFVFPSISWSPKGQQIARIIEDMQLRPPNVLFLDDNVSNLEEARYYAAGIQTAGPDLIGALLSLEQLKGKDDRALSRLGQYRLLEQKAADKAVTAGSNDDFLRSCNIEVYLGTDCLAESERLVELINRSNQLNYTKHRVTVEEFRAMLTEPGRETRCVRVTDRYGDYGICGIFSVLDGQLTDYVFSCRILHMGVEQWLYQHLGRPRLSVVGEVSTPIERSGPIDWITLIDRDPSTSAPVTASDRTISSRVLLKGGCDLWLIHDFLHGALETEFAYTSATGADVRNDHTEILRRSTEAALSEFGHVIDRLPFLDRDAYSSKLMQAPDRYGTIVYSALMDYTQGLYRLRDTSFVVPYGQYDEDITAPDNWESLEAQWGAFGIDRPFLEWFSERFDFEGPLTPDAFQDSIRWMARAIPADTRLVVINGAELALENEMEPNRHLHHRLMNAALDDVVAELPNASVCDVRGLVVEVGDLIEPNDRIRTNIRHYSRRVYLQIAESLKELIRDDLVLETRTSVVQIRKFQRRARRKLERTLKDLRRR